MIKEIWDWIKSLFQETPTEPAQRAREESLFVNIPPRYKSAVLANSFITSPELLQDRLKELNERFPSSIPDDLYTDKEISEIKDYLKKTFQLKEFKYDAVNIALKSKSAKQEILINVPRKAVSPSNAIVDVGYVVVVVRSFGRDLSTQYFYISFATAFTRWVLENKRDIPSAAAVANQLGKFIEDSRRNPFDRIYPINGGGNIGRWSGGIQRIAANVDPDIEQRCFAEAGSEYGFMFNKDENVWRKWTPQSKGESK